MSRTFTITLEAVGIPEIERVILRRDNGAIEAVAVYDVRDDAGAVFYSNKHLSIPLTPAQRSAITAFVTGTVIPAINEHEQLNED